MFSLGDRVQLIGDVSTGTIESLDCWEDDNGIIEYYEIGISLDRKDLDGKDFVTIDYKQVRRIG